MSTSPSAPACRDGTGPGYGVERLGESEALASPETLRAMEFVLTARCNLACSYCYQDARQRRRMDWTTLRAGLDLMLRSRRRQIRLLFCGGEPLLELPLLRRAVEHVERERRPDQEIRFALVTNGTLLHPEAAAFLERHGFAVQISFDGIPAAQRARGPGTFRALDGLLDRVRRDHPGLFRDASVSSTLTSATVPYLADSFDYFVGKGVREIAVSMSVTPDPGWRLEQIDDLDRQFERISRRSLEILEETGAVPFVLFRKGGGNMPTDRPVCAAGGGATVTLDADGQVVGCVMFAASYQSPPPGALGRELQALRLGNLRRPGFARRLRAYPAAARRSGLFHGRERRHSAYGRCSECRFVTACAVCPASLGRGEEDRPLQRVPAHLCAFNRVCLAHRERFPAAPAILDMLAGRAPLPGPLRRLGLAVPRRGAARRASEGGGGAT